VEGARVLEAEHDNLRAALGWALARAPGEALRLAAALVYFWRMCGHGLEGRGWLARALERAPVAHPCRAPALTGAGPLARHLGASAASAALAAEALPLARASGDDRSIALALNELVALRVREPGPEPIAHAREMLDRSRAAGFGWGAAAALSLL